MKARPGYCHRLTAAAEKHKELFPKGRVAEMDIAHDSWCAIYMKAPCNCQPFITLLSQGVAYSIDLYGNAIPRN